MTYNLSRAEQETLVRFDAEERVAHIYTVQHAIAQKLDKLSAAFPQEYKLISRDDRYGERKYEAPMKYIRFGKPMSEEQRAQRVKAINSNPKRFTSKSAPGSPSDSSVSEVSTDPDR